MADANKKIQIAAPLFLSISMAIGMVIGFNLRDSLPTGSVFFGAQKQTPLVEVAKLVESKYVDSLKKPNVLNRAINGLLSGCDPYSQWSPSGASSNEADTNPQNHSTKIVTSYLQSPTVGYIKINSLAQNSYIEFMQNMDTLVHKGATSIILDLKGTHEGILGETVAIADEFLSDNKLIVYTKGDNTPPIEFTCKKEGVFEKGNLQVLVDEKTASEAEVLAGALQDWDRATITGTPTMGKGMVQEKLNLGDGSMLTLSVARYYTPLGRTIQKPFEDHAPNEKTKIPSPKYFITHNGKKLLGNGGITPL